MKSIDLACHHSFIALSLLLPGDAQMLMEDCFYTQSLSFISPLLCFFVGNCSIHQKGKAMSYEDRIGEISVCTCEPPCASSREAVAGSDAGE